MIVSSETSYLLAGHSHIAALGIPLHRDQSEIVSLPGLPGWGGFTGPWNGNRDSAYWDDLVAAAPGRTIIVNWSGNEHNALFLLRVSPDFDFVVGEDDLDRASSNAPLVPRIMVDALFDARLSGLADVVGRLVAAGAEKVVVLGTPPPKRDLDTLRHVIGSSEFWRARSIQLGQDPELPAFSPPKLRLKLWMVLQQRMEHFAHSNEGQFLAVPTMVQDGEGFLKPEFWARDLTHANSDYGKIVLSYLATLEGLGS